MKPDHKIVCERKWQTPILKTIVFSIIRHIQDIGFETIKAKSGFKNTVP